MEFTSNGVILGTRRHGEGHVVAEIFTESAGRMAGLVYGGQSRTKQPILQAGNNVQCTWKGRSEDSLGHFTLEMTEARAAGLMHDQLALMAMTSITSLCQLCLPEREAMPQLYVATQVIFSQLEEVDVWPVLLPKWELGLLTSAGFGLTLEICAATGQKLEDGANLCFVSPKSGGAVTYEAGMPYKDKLLPLPPFLIERGDPIKEDVVAALRLSGFFIEDRLLAPANRKMPDARDRLMDRIARWAKT